jgi:type IV pilus assembly protein PilB
LLSTGTITRDQLESALSEGAKSGKRLGEVLIEQKVITEMQLIDVLGVQIGVDFIDLTKTAIPLSLAQVVPKNIAKKYSVVPVRMIGDELYLAMVDPLNFVAIGEVKNATKKRIVPMIATAFATNRAIMTLYGNEGVNRAIDELSQTITVENGGFGSSDKPNASTLDEEDTQSAPTIRLVNSILERAIAENASDIHLEPREDGMVVRMRIDGILHTILNVPKNLQPSITSRIKVMSNMDIAERRLPQDGRTNVKLKSYDIDLRVSTLPTIYGEKIVIRLLMKSREFLTTQGIGLSGGNLKKYEALTHNTSGVILIVGPTGSGKSSSMYTMIAEVNSEEVNLVTLEDPVEYNLAGVNQVQINEKIGMTFASGLRSILRQDPDIVAVGEIRDAETAEIAMRAAITGHLVLSTVHTNDAISTLDRLLDLGIEPYLITSALKGIISQRLVRKICPNCRREYVPADEELENISLDRHALGNRRFYRGEGCSECLNTGYRGRTAVFEILMMTADIKQKFHERAPREELLKAIHGSGFQTILQDCARLVLDGVTTAEEAYRVLHSTDA